MNFSIIIIEINPTPIRIIRVDLVWNFLIKFIAFLDYHRITDIISVAFFFNSFFNFIFRNAHNIRIIVVTLLIRTLNFLLWYNVITKTS